ncbi:hypothetical protein PsYK624_048180 [Phanerochaete sordida]|uniref:Uncharacterized protein n=1 Tax=Phanerochaete sordida TaxID=48140 RepID=A0A9P3LB08_9APHY|nr:hypothetical protein PsYK624_048180 [Phanerochaete sordida]
MASTSTQHHADKFESLGLPPVWEGAAGHVDYQLSNPDASSYRTALAATWRSLQPITQRSYVVVAVKKAEAQLRKRPGRRLPGAAEAHMILLNNVFELLWVTPSPNAGTQKPRKAPSRARTSAAARVDGGSTAAIKPLSPAWHCIAEEGERCLPERLRLDISSCPELPRPSRRPVSPLARFSPMTADDDGMEDLSDQFHNFPYSDDSDTASDWSSRE